jgi:putative oxidoreductase
MTLKSLASSAIALVESIPVSFTGLVSRLAIADVFWRSGETKVDGWQVTQTTFDLFRDEYKVPLLPPELAAYMAAIQEHLFSALLVVGLASRLSALGLIGMTLVIQLFVYPGNWPDHLLWFSVLIVIVARGPGKISLDHLIKSALTRTSSMRSAVPLLGGKSTIGA